MNQFCHRENMIKQFLKSVAAVNPAKLIEDNVKIEKENLHVCDKVYDLTDKNVYLVGFGKAVLGMASQCEKILKEHLKSGVICGPHNIRESFKNESEFLLQQNSVIELHEGAKNNLPDSSAERGADEIIKLVQSLKFDKDYLIVLISGGGSALFPKPKPDISLAEKLETVNLLMTSGANINDLNTVRKKISLVKGGGLALLSHPVRTICLIISDVINDPIDIIASGPTVPNSDPPLTAFNVLQKYNLESKVPVSILDETKKLSSELNAEIINNKFLHVDNFIVGNNRVALNAAKKYAVELGYETVILSDEVRGNVQSVADFYTNMLYEILNGLHNKSVILKDSLTENCDFDIDGHFLEGINNLIKKQTAKTVNVIAGGETTVEVIGNGKGGRNQHLSLLLSMRLHELKLTKPNLFAKYDVKFLFCGTDGIDGPTDAAGAAGDLTVVEKAGKLNLTPQDFLSRHDSYNFFSKIDNGSFLIKTGHTGTNVMDIHIFLISEKQSL